MQRLCPQRIISIVDEMKWRYAVRIRRWRQSMTGCAWSTLHADGSRVNWIECPYPKTPISLAIFLHEVGHHAIGFDTYKRRCEEELHVWRWAIATMRTMRIDPDANVERRVELSVKYALEKALRRGMKIIPDDLCEFASDAA